MYVANLLADNSQELEKLKTRFASSCEYRISSAYKNFELDKKKTVNRSFLGDVIGATSLSIIANHLLR